VALEVHALTSSQDLVLLAKFARGQRRGEPRALLDGNAQHSALDVPDLDSLFGTMSGRIQSGGAIALCASGRLAPVAGVCLGDLAPDGQHAAQRAAHDAVVDCLGHLGVPILAGLPIGHGLVNQPLPLGAPALLDSSRASLTSHGRRASA
jgi:hypothetical protein